ncbi:MAG TPA: hypothetical protein PLV83_02240 [Bacilli bacterium]|nr:hypothetical protein [Bacilli bacterium]
MKKLIIISLLAFLVTGCTVVRIATNNIDSMVDVVLSKNNTLYNTVGKGYKYYKPRGVTYIDTSEYNEKLYSNGNYYYLYIDINSYFYKKEFTYKENKDAYYSRYIDINEKKGYLEINEQDGYYLVEFMYNYAKIEALVKEEDINTTVLDASYILSTIKYNSNVIKLVLNEDYFTNKDTVYDLFTPKKVTTDFLEYNDDNYNESEEKK